MQRPRLKTKMSKKKKAALAAAIALVLALLIGGAFAWTDFSQSFKNLFHGTATPDVLLHDDFTPNVNKDVYVENTGQTPLVVRVQFAEYLQVGNDAVIGQDAKDSSTWRVRDWSGTTIGTDGVVAANDNLHDWLMSGNQKWYLPGTSEIDDVTYTSAVTGGNGNTTKQTLPAAPVVTMSYYLANKANLDTSYPDGFWILDDSDTGNGWCYWSQLLPKDEATNLLLDNVTLNPDMTPDDNWAYNIDVRLQAANKTEAYKLGSVGGISSEGKALINSLLGLNTIANPQDKFDSGSDQLLNLKPVPGYPGLYKVLDDNGKSAHPKSYLVDPDGSVKDDSSLSGDEVSADADFVSRLTKTYPSGLPSGDAAGFGTSNGNPAVVDSNGDILIDAVNFPDGQMRSMLENGYDTVIYNANGGFTASATSTTTTKNVHIDPIDVNGDGKLNVAELMALTEFYANNNQITNGVNNSSLYPAFPAPLTTVKGIELFPDVVVFQASNNKLSSNPTTKMPGLKSLCLNSNPDITSVDVSNNPQLEDLQLWYLPHLTSIDLSNNPLLTAVSITQSQITSIDLSIQSDLQRVVLSTNTQLSTVILPTDKSAVAELDVRKTALSSLDMSGRTSLATLLAFDCPNLTSVDVSNDIALTNLRVYWGLAGNGPLASIDLSGCAQLVNGMPVYLNNQSLTTLDLSTTSLNYNGSALRFQDNDLQSLIVPADGALPSGGTASALAQWNNTTNSNNATYHWAGNDSMVITQAP